MTSAGFVVVAWLLAHYTRWGRQFWRLAWPYFTPKRSWKPLLTLALVLLLALFAVRMNVLFSFWSKDFYDAVQALDASKFWLFMGLFGVLASIHVVRELFTYYVQQSFEIHWRTWLNEKLSNDWLERGAYYRGQFVPEPTDNPDQRIQVDIASFVTFSLSLSIGAIRALVSLVEFTIILWALSGALALWGVEIPRGMVFLVYLYVLVATVFAFKIGRPLIQLNFLNEKLGADFRYALMRLREYSENIAFYRGENVERNTLFSRFQALIKNIWAIVFRTLKFNGFNLTVSQIAVIFPWLIQAPRFLAGQIKLGDVMQTARAFGEVEEALSFFRMSYDNFAQYRAVLNRLTGFMEANQQARDLPVVQTQEQLAGLSLQGVTVQRPDGAPLLQDLNFSLGAGESLLVKGASGSGKTTLLRTLAGLWPYAAGVVARPVGARALFLSQKPYLPLGSLRTAVTYPAEQADDALVQTALRKVQLGHLLGRLDEEADWSRILSLGEQQRLAFARLLINQPHIAFLDEATSATDEGLEHSLYELLRHELPQCTLISVGHRSTLNGFHQRKLELQGEGRWALS
ncbi:MAG: ABC transporter ATP-binding protein/permease [Burkholderiales bacterium]|nr:ABC transporter ATP-binding protein/permease [Burkholderiales bacterium]MCA3155034.1 ABC transporter ATP-binding protein/permease [Burkholderiales bacterium]MCA3156501.1 ABC transporter ATP-binding protein/permease [Burkholderiales bacterium]MCA3168989.1 ABC transporter ATP-binding protein/permease [Burkholderiales bacterium]